MAGVHSTGEGIGRGEAWLHVGALDLAERKRGGAISHVSAVGEYLNPRKRSFTRW